MTTTRVLRCRPESIRFNEEQQVEIGDEETEKALTIAVQHLRRNSTPIAFPTETVYGLGASALRADAVAEIFKTKGRPADNPLIVHISSIDMLHRILPKSFTLPDHYSALIHRFWPGALSLLFPANPDLVPPIVTANHPTVAVRMPSNPVARALIALADTPLAAPSANTSGNPSPTKAEHVFRDLQGKISVIVDGGSCAIGLESTVVDGLEPQLLNVLRPGGVTVEDIEDCLRESNSETCRSVQVRVHRRDYQDIEIERAPTTPGMKYRHYSPRVPVILLMNLPPPIGARQETFPEIIRDLLATERNRSGKLRIGLLLTVDSQYASPPPHSSIEWQFCSLGFQADKSTIANRLFDGLLDLERRDVDVILTESVDESHFGLAIMNRLTKAASEARWLRRQ